MVISCKIFNSSMKFKFIHKISIIQEKSLVFFNSLRMPAITRNLRACIPVIKHQVKGHCAFDTHFIGSTRLTALKTKYIPPQNDTDESNGLHKS